MENENNEKKKNGVPGVKDTPKATENKKRRSGGCAVVAEDTQRDGTGGWMVCMRESLEETDSDGNWGGGGLDVLLVR